MAAIRPSSDDLLVGAGIVGLSIALALQERGAHAVVVERAGVARGTAGSPRVARLVDDGRGAARGARPARVRLVRVSPSRDSEPVLERLAAAVRVQNAAECRRGSCRRSRRGSSCPA